MPAPAELLQLIQRFEEQKEQYFSQAYNETQVRREFIDPLLEALGWDVSNKAGYAEQYKDVVHEDSIKVNEATKAPDYSCRIGGQRKFFVEAKKPAVRLHDDPKPAYQLRRYGWSAKLPISLLTNFAELAVYDCRIKPEQSDKASQARIMYLTYDQLLEKWDELVALFSPEAIRKGAFDRYAQDNKKKRGTAEVDAVFLEEISQWREQLAENIALRNKDGKLKSRQLSYAVQSTIDRLIFLRIAEDRGIEPYGRLLELTQHKEIYPTLTRMFQAADAKYNSGLFHFKEEKGRSNDSLDTFTLTLKIDDKVLKEIIKRLYYPDSPYQFNMIPADILGQVYEQFLGKVIRLTPKGQAKIEDKPEVKKAGGVFYTPTYIVQYIVEQTVGRLLEGQTAGEKGTASQLTICDPSCGSGSFLIGAYQYLLDWHLAQYTATPETIAKWRKGKNPPLMETGQGGYRLTINERKRILLNNIYGVDIDQQAVEVTKLSLLLKVLEGETEQSLAAQMSLVTERVLPDLDRNVKCGNSLIAPDFYESYNQLGLGFIDEEEAYRINVFDWHTAFPQVFAAGGFSAVIGNPPYGAYFSPEEQAYIRSRYTSYQYKYDSYIYFMEKALTISISGGLVSFITPELWLRLENNFPLRKLLAQKAGFERLHVFGENVFTNAVINTIVFLFHVGGTNSFIDIETSNEIWQLPTSNWQKAPLMSIDYRAKPQALTLIERIKKQSIPLRQFGNVIQGLTPYDRYQGQSAEIIKNRSYHFSYKKDETCGKWLSGKDVSRYVLSWSGEWLSYGDWLAAPRTKDFFEGPRLLFREIPGKEKRIQATFTDETSYYGHSVTPFKLNNDCELSLKFLLGIVNSKLISWYGNLMLPNFGKNIFPKLNPNDVKELPICRLNFFEKKDKLLHDKMVSLVDSILGFNYRLKELLTPHEKTILERQITATDRQIDQLVYTLYGLTPEEIALVEEA